MVGGGLSAGAMVSLAGCSGGGGGGGTAVFHHPNTQDYNTIQGNLHAAVDFDPWHIPQFVNTPYLNYNNQTGELTNYLLKDISVDGNTMTISIRDGFKWHDGTAVTADDVVTQYRLAYMSGDDPRGAAGNLENLFDSFDGIRKTGDLSAEFKLANELNEQTAILWMFHSQASGTAALWPPAKVFSKFTEAYGDATTESEKEDANSRLLEFTWDFDEVIGTGPWQFEETSGTEFRFSLFEDHPDSDLYEWNELVMPRQNQNDLIPAARSGNITSTYHNSPNADDANSLPDGWKSKNVGGPTPGGPALICNHEHDIYGMREVKQAFAHIVRGQGVSESLGTHYTDPVPPTYTFSKQLMETYMGSPIEGNLNVYNSTDKASELLQSAGFTEKNGKWHQPDGSPFEPTIKVFKGAPFTPTAQTVAGQLSNFGIETDVQVVESGVFFSKYPEGQYDLVVEFWSAGGANPYFGFLRNTIGFTGSSMLYPNEVTVPKVGNMGGQEQTFNVEELLNSALTADGQDQFVSEMRKLAWIANVTLPEIPTVMWKRIFFYDTNGWNWPADDSPLYGYNDLPSWPMRQGEISPSN
ncbi:ABC transporter substrate-binding protein [Halocatena marina]|uniref:ABC transporter substrate-binding protein n=3 Tax=Halocatena marina TaxID=2934937 RepID=A0ABD5YWT7_9EURY|nr:ABC transporter substrate-binding protein [Halocatena marina]